ncbi:type II secretion system protein [Thermus oshimai]|uniref:type II secretion system protein n=1 Tax=Thermus oshimai TaxID=56957 RepID=UPI00037AC5E6|nr:prepilin-type N-terminal cleavage/methylation domain-containing protein [Thermus oshimai]
MRNSKGFTLIELAIVIVIIGILVAIAVPRFVDMTTEARRSQRQATLSSIRSAYAIYIAKNSGNYPNWTQLQGALQDAPTELKLASTGGVVYMDYDGDGTADTGEGVATLYSNDACSTAVADATTAIRCIKGNID